MPQCRIQQSRLKIFRGPQQLPAGKNLDEELTDEGSVTLPAGEVLPLLADAIANQRTWLSDFEEDEITISADLYEVLMAYQFFRRPSA